MRTRPMALLAALTLVAFSAPLASATPDHGHGPHGAPNHGSGEAAKLCAQQKKADKAAFRALWGKHAMRDCIRAGGAEDEVATSTPEEIHNAAQECRAERKDDSEGFAATYGTNHNDRNVFGKCVSTKVRADDAASPL